MPVQITLLGVPSISLDGTPAAVDTRKALALVAHLALSDRSCSRESLCDLLWAEYDSSGARGALRRTLSTVRGAIGAAHVDTAGDGVALVRGPDLRIDVDRFRALAAGDASHEELEAAAAVFTGPLLDGFALRDGAGFEAWQHLQSGALERELSDVLRRLTAALAARGEPGPALTHARRWLALDQLHEPAHRAVIRMHALSGNRAAALEQYRACVRTLNAELGVAPLQETAELFEQINDGRLAVHPAPPSAAPQPAAATPLPELPVVGREAELAELVSAHAACRAGGGLVIIEGEAGIGKTRLLEELARRARADGAVVLAARCHDDEIGLPYGPVVDLLRDVLRHSDRGWMPEVAPQQLADAALLLPELGALRRAGSTAMPLGGPAARVRLLEAIGAILAAACRGSTPGIVHLDDVHNADEATVDTVVWLGRRLADFGFLLVVSWRTEGISPGHRLRRLAAHATHESSATIVSPRRLTPSEVDELVDLAVPGGDGPDLRRRVFVESEGLPLFVVQYLAAHAAGGPAPTPGALPADVQGFLTARLAGLGAVARQVLGAAAAIGRSFDLATVREASGRGEEELVSALEDLLTEGVVRELAAPEPSYDFSHDKLRSLVYEQTSRARRRLLHGRIAAALARGAGADAHAALIAHHLHLGGDDEAAAAQHRIAAEHAAALHAHADALVHLDAALALGEPDVAGAHERIGDLRTLQGDYTGALTAYGIAAAHAEPTARAIVDHKLGNVHHRRGEWTLAQARFAGALGAPGDDALRAQVGIDLGHTLHQLGEGDHARSLAREALGAAEAAGDASGRARAHNLLGVLALGAGDLDGASSQLDRSLAIAGELHDDVARAAALNNLALVRREAGELDRARELTRQALALCVACGDRHREAALENNLADLEHALGDEQASREHLRRAVAIFAEVGAEEATRLPEIWKLVSW